MAWHDYQHTVLIKCTISDTPVLALTGTADNKMVKKIKAQLPMGPLTVSITLPPERPDIRFQKRLHVTLQVDSKYD